MFSIRLILWSHSLYSGNFSNFFLLNKCMNSWIYSSKYFEFIKYSFLLIFCCSLFVSSVGCSLYILDVNKMSWCCILHSVKHFVNHIVSIFQFTSRLCSANQLYPKNMSVPFNSMTSISILFTYPLISSSSGANIVIFLFLVLSVLKILNNLFIGSVLSLPVIYQFQYECILNQPVP